MEFVNSHHPGHFKSRAARDIVRSHVARRQHQQARDLGKNPAFMPPGSGHTFPAINEESPATPELPGFGLLKPSKSGLQVLNMQKRKVRRKQSCNGPPDAAITKISAAIALGPELSLPNPSLIFDAIAGYLDVAFDPLGWPALGISDEDGATWQRYMTGQSIVEPALRYTRLLFGAAILCQHKVVRQEVRSWLYQRATAAVCHGIVEHDLNQSEALIVSIASLAFYESMFGDPQRAQDVYRPEQQRLVARKGGLEELDLPPVVKRIMLWADAVMSRQTKSGPMLGRETDRGEVDTWNALEIWLPVQYAALMSDADDQMD